MKMTYQLVSGSGSFSSPEEMEIEHGTKADARGLLEYWIGEHNMVGSDPADASLLAWVGQHEDITDHYPDYEIKAGPRGGVRWNHF